MKYDPQGGRDKKCPRSKLEKLCKKDDRSMVRLRGDVKIQKCSLAQSEQIDSFICKQCILCSLGGRDSTAGIPATPCSRRDSDIYIDVLFMPQLPQAERESKRALRAA